MAALSLATFASNASSLDFLCLFPAPDNLPSLFFTAFPSTILFFVFKTFLDVSPCCTTPTFNFSAAPFHASSPSPSSGCWPLLLSPNCFSVFLNVHPLVISIWTPLFLNSLSTTAGLEIKKIASSSSTFRFFAASFSFFLSHLARPLSPFAPMDPMPLLLWETFLSEVSIGVASWAPDRFRAPIEFAAASAIVLVNHVLSEKIKYPK